MSSSQDDTIATWMFVSKVQYWIVLIISSMSMLVLCKAMHMTFLIRKSHYFPFLLSILAADIAMLMIIVTELVSQTLFPHIKGPITCKAMHFASNVAATFANWTWVLMFLQRCTLVFFPLKRIDAGVFGLLHSSRKLLLLNLGFSMITQSWALVLITERQISLDNEGVHVTCERDDTVLDEWAFKWVALSEAVTTYLLPFVCTIGTDLAVLLWTRHQSSPFTLIAAEGVSTTTLKGERPDERSGFKIQSSKSIQSHLKRRQVAIRRCLVMATVQVILNAPHYTLQVADEIYALSYTEQYAKLYFYLDAFLYILYLVQFPILIVHIWFLNHQSRSRRRRNTFRRSFMYSSAHVTATPSMYREHGHDEIHSIQSKSPTNNHVYKECLSRSTSDNASSLPMDL